MENIVGKIYCITNQINGKQYIGKTILSVERRFWEHKSERLRSPERPLYRAMNKYGVENFTIETLEECDYKILSEREMYWISQKGTYHNGYNATLGGEGKILYNYEQIVDKYRSGMLIKELAEYFECSVETIRIALHSADIDISDKPSLKKQVHCEKDGQQYSFVSAADAAKWVVQNKLTTATSLTGIAASIGKAANGKLKTYLKYKWWWD